MNNYKMVDLSIFDRVNNLNISDANKYNLDETLYQYRFFINNLKYLSDNESFPVKERNAFLKNMKEQDIKDNQITENENETLIEIYRYLDKESVTDSLIKRRGKPISLEELKYYHKLLLKGTSSNSFKDDYVRCDNNHWVGTEISEKERDVHYMPIDYKDIPKALELLVDYYNNDKLNDENDIFVKPFLFHLLIATLQIFDDGNTRLARVFQHIKLWNYTNSFYGIHLTSPILYLTKPYKIYRPQYREIIKDVANDDSDKSINKWLEFNLYRAQEQLYKQSSDLEELKGVIKRYRR